MENNNIEEKLRNLEEWNRERARIKPYIDIALDYHNRARTEAHRNNYDRAAHLYRQAIENYKNAVSQNPKYYLQDLLDRIDNIIGEHINNIFNLKTSGDRLKNDKGIQEFVNFIDGLKLEERRYIDPYEISLVFFRIGDLYYEEGSLKKAYDFYERAVEIHTDRPFLNRDAYFKMAVILFEQERFKEALVDFVSVLSFDRENKEAISYLDNCLKRLNISEHRAKFLKATPNEAKKLIMEVL